MLHVSKILDSLKLKAQCQKLIALDTGCQLPDSDFLWVEQIGAYLVYENMSKVYSIKTIQQIPVSAEKAWDFFSSPDNLETITPDNIGFKIVSQHHGEKMYAGQIIEYKVSPFLGISFYWMTEITQVENKTYFIDEQRYGPYSLWHHQHHFKEIPGGVEMTDIVHYKLPLWFMGDLAHALFVKKQLKEIFDYRFKKVEALFGSVKTV